MKRLLLAAVLVLWGCPAAPEAPLPAPDSPYCTGSYTIGKRAEDAVEGVIQAIMGGEKSTDRRATVQMRMTNGLCTGVAIDEHTVLTAAHCTDGSYDTSVVIGTEPGTFVATRVTEHPEYMQWSHRLGGDPHSDIAIVKVEEKIPAPYVTKVFDPANEEHVSRCAGGFVAQGWGRWEGTELDLRETEYDIDDLTEKLVITDNEPGEGRICFGDSGGPLYALMDNGELWLVGLARTTGSMDCTIQSTHVRASWAEGWVNANK
jgi:hypothetical protein